MHVHFARERDGDRRRQQPACKMALQFNIRTHPITNTLGMGVNLVSVSRGDFNRKPVLLKCHVLETAWALLRVYTYVWWFSKEVRPVMTANSSRLALQHCGQQQQQP